MIKNDKKGGFVTKHNNRETKNNSKHNKNQGNNSNNNIQGSNPKNVNNKYPAKTNPSQQNKQFQQQKQQQHPTNKSAFKIPSNISITIKNDKAIAKPINGYKSGYAQLFAEVYVLNIDCFFSSFRS